MKRIYPILALVLLNISAYSQIECPADITLQCDIDYTNTALVGEPVITDAAGNIDYTTKYDVNLDACNEGFVIAEYTSAGDPSKSCTQKITLENDFEIFDPENIIFPEDIPTNETDIVTCYEVDLDYMPSWSAGTCDFIGYTYDLKYETNEDGKYIIKRYISVIDWCLYDKTNGSEGVYTHTQTITLTDEEKPNATVSANVNLTNNQSHLIRAIDLDDGSIDDCTATDQLRYTLTDVRPELDPTYDPTKKSSTIEIGTNDTTLIVYVWDLAGNYDSAPVGVNFITSVIDENQNALRMYQNVPNPFQQSTSIPFELDQGGEVTITIADLHGRTLMKNKSKYAAGNHTYTIACESLPKGVLLCAMQINGKSKSIKIINE